MERLHFGARARRRARLKRIALWLSVLSLIAIGLGVPGTDVGLRLVESLGGSDGPVASSGTIQTSRVAESALRFRRVAFERRSQPSLPARSGARSRRNPPSPTAIAKAGRGTSVTDIVYAAAARHGLSGAYLLSVAQCESSLDPNAYNPAGYHGLFQFDYQTWAAYGSGGIYDPAAQAEAAAELIAAGQSSRWPNCA